jgi:ubiquinone/menaquinone biosynthesis C-methylase UbiE
MFGEGRKRKENILKTFNKIASTYGSDGPGFFSHCGMRLVELSKITEGMTTLDVATGRGAVLIPMLDKVGGSGRVIGVDLSEGMIRETSAEIKKMGLENVELHQMDAGKLSFPDDHFDVVLCGFAVFLFPNELNELYRVLKPGGQIGATTFFRDCDYMRMFIETISAYQEFGPPALLDVDALEKILADAAFENVTVTKEEHRFLYKDKKEWWAAIWTMPTRMTLEKMNPKTREKFKEDIFAKLACYQQENALNIPINVLFAFGDKKG